MTDPTADTLPPSRPPTTPTPPIVRANAGPLVNFSFVLTDMTTSATPTALRPQGSALQDMIDAVLEQVNGVFADAHGHVLVAMRVCNDPSDRQTGEIAAHFRDTLDVPNALAYHMSNSGVPDIEIGCSLFTSLTSGTESTSGGFGHEILELLKDAGANGYKDDTDRGVLVAEEVVDPVQNTGYKASNSLWVPNFVLPSYWVPGAMGPYDHLGLLASPTNSEIVKYGYEVQCAEPGATSQISAMLAPARPHPTLSGKHVFAVGSLSAIAMARKRQATSRTRRRGVSL